MDIKEIKDHVLSLLGMIDMYQTLINNNVFIDNTIKRDHVLSMVNLSAKQLSNEIEYYKDNFKEN